MSADSSGGGSADRPGVWRRFRSRPWWAQALAWLLLLMLVFSLLGIAMAEPPPSERTERSSRVVDARAGEDVIGSVRAHRSR